MAPLEVILPTVAAIRRAGVAVDIAYTARRLKKALDIANRAGIPYVGIIGEDEVQAGVIALKDMAAGTQESLTLEQVIQKLSE